MGALLILGGRSDIGGELACRLCVGRPVVLAARGEHGMEKLRSKLMHDGARSVHTLSFDAADVSSHRSVIEQASALADEDITTAVVAFGILGDQERAEHDEAHAFDIALVDFAAQVSILTVLADVMTTGHIVAFSSIAGWRARRANYVYGSTKAGLDAFCQGLADRLQGSDLALITARPGFVIGSMTEGMKPAPLSVTPDVVAQAVVKAIESSSGTESPSDSRPVSRTLWIPRRLKVLAWIMKLVPRPIWRHMPR
ncbi:SDR family oxidoreductase [Corynebacterium aurimucosum]|uniref:SDR family oxidoreductase n=1 Tax=Corynebacterium aurimucosum TaxID=169292 RepID=UPI003990C6BA